ncbi:hypothetical protein CMI37_10745 [Candidatus Pacearchaeota archaeon]|nr:hypothetical protein [Candidatus Pacearchaeota archaeon]|tara:strand:+ start:124 stop:1539 length:1416 start_codon:yes stop_codon:yes gene_type:complete
MAVATAPATKTYGERSPVRSIVPDPMKQETLRQLAITLSPMQRAPYFCDARLLQVPGGWRAGKSFNAALWQWCRIMTGPLHWIVGPDYWQAMAEFNYIVAFAKAAGLWKSNTSDKRGANTLILNVSYPLGDPSGELIKVETKSAVHPEKLGSVAPATILMVEAGQQTKEVRDILIGRTAELRAPMMMSGTFEKAQAWYVNFYEHNLLGHGVEYIRGAQVFRLPTHSNETVFPGGLNNPEIQHQQEVLPEDFFNEKFLAFPSRPQHLVFGKWRQPELQRGTPSWGPGIDMTEPVYLAIDPGTAHPHAVCVFQMEGNTAWLLDLVWLKNRTCQQVIDECKERAWWDKVTYWVIDVAAGQRGPERSYLDIWRENLPGIPYGTTKIALLAGNNLHRQCLIAEWGDPKLMLFECEATSILEWEYDHHHYKKAKDGEPLEEPHPFDDDAIKATTYFLWDRFHDGSQYEPETTSVVFA